MVGHFTDSDVVLEFLGRAKLFDLAALGTSCPDHFLRTKVKPLVLDLPADGHDRGVRRAAGRAARRIPRGLRAPTTSARPTDDSPADARRRPGDHSRARGRDVLLRPDKQTARVAGEFYVNAINVMRGAESVSTYAPISEDEKFRIEYWALEEAKLQRMPKPKPPRRADRARHRRRQRHRQGHRRPGWQPKVRAS